MSESEDFEFRYRMEQERTYMPPPRSGIPEPGPSSVADDVMGMARAAGQWAKQGALPAIGSIALPAAATAIFPPAAALAPVLRGIGSGLGEAGNQALGITEPSWKQIAASTLVPMGMEAGANLLRTGKALAPALQTQAPQMATGQMSGYKSAVPASALFDQATKQGVTIPLTKTALALQTLRTTLDDATPAARKAFETVLKQTGVEDLATAPGGGINPAKMQYLLADIGKLQAQAAKEGGLKAGYMGKFFAALSDDLDASGAALGPARQAFKRESVLNELDDAIDAAFFIKKGVGQQGEFSANKILNMLNKTDTGTGKFFAQAMTKGEQREIKDLFGFLNTLPSLQPGAGQQFGSGQMLDRLTKAGAGSGIGGGVGFLYGGPVGAGIGAGIGALAPEAAKFGSLLMQAWKMPGGRQVTRSLLTNSDGALTPQVMGTLSAFVTSKLANPAPERPMIEPGRTMLQPMPNER